QHAHELRRNAGGAGEQRADADADDLEQDARGTDMRDAPADLRRAQPLEPNIRPDREQKRAQHERDREVHRAIPIASDTMYARTASAATTSARRRDACRLFVLWRGASLKDATAVPCPASPHPASEYGAEGACAALDQGPEGPSRGCYAGCSSTSG